MGSEKLYPEERPVRRSRWTGSGWTRTLSRRPSSAASCARRGMSPSPSVRSTPPSTPALTLTAVPGSLVFRGTTRPVHLDDVRAWWEYVPGAGGGDRAGRERPSTAATATPSSTSRIEDGEAYAAWAGKELPTEAEWEFAARGGLEGATFAWGDELAPGGRRWRTRGRASSRGRTSGRRLEGTSPVGTFPPNGYGLYDMTGNIWEWTTDWYRLDPTAASARLLHAAQSRVRAPSRATTAPAGDQDPAQGDQRRLASLRAELLPALPPCGAPGRADRHVDVAHRLPLHRAGARCG